MPISSQDVVTGFARSTRAAVVVDFDGTISEIVERPVAARPVDGAVAALLALTERVERVLVLSSRPVSFLQRVLEPLSPSIELIGHSGLERAVGSDTVVDPVAESWLPAVHQAFEDVVATAPARLPIEDKRLSFTIHYRPAPQLQAEAERLAEWVAAQHGLHLNHGRMHIEVRPPLTIDKGTALRRTLTGDLDWLLYAGDDVVDLPACHALRALAGGVPAGVSVCVAIGTEEAPPELLAAADLVLPSPSALVALLAELAVTPKVVGAD